MRFKQILALLLALTVCLTGCGRTPKQTQPSTAPEPDSQPMQTAEGELVILFTGDVHGVYQRQETQGNLGYAAVAKYREQLAADGTAVILLDAGDALEDGGLSSRLVDVMNEAGYAAAVPGDRELGLPGDTFPELAKNQAEYRYLACNLVDAQTGETVLEPFWITETGGVRVAFLGICTPEAAVPPSCKLLGGSDGEELYQCVQQAIDEAHNQGADYVIAVGHLGTDPAGTPWTSVEVIANTTGLTAFVDGHSHSVLPGTYISDRDDNQVLLCAAGEKLAYVGAIRLDLASGAATSSLISDLTDEDGDVLALVEDITAQTAPPTESTAEPGP